MTEDTFTELKRKLSIVLSAKKDNGSLSRAFYKDCRDNGVSIFEAKELLNIISTILDSTNFDQKDIDYRKRVCEKISKSMRKSKTKNIDELIQSILLECNNTSNVKTVLSKFDISRAYLYKLLKTKKHILEDFIKVNSLNDSCFLSKYVSSLHLQPVTTQQSLTSNDMHEPTTENSSYINLTPLADQIQYGWVKYDPDKKVYVKTDKYPKQVTR